RLQGDWSSDVCSSDLKVAEHYKLDVRQYQRVETVNGQDGDFHITTCDRLGRIYDYGCRKVIVSTGYYDRANLLRVPGEDSLKVRSEERRVGRECRDRG